MARMITSRTSTKSPAVAAGTKRLGRPLGSKNKTSLKAKTRTPATASRRLAPKKSAAPAAPKMSKAALELHVAKLERSIARLRKQNAELKQTVRDDPEKAPVAKASTKPVGAIAAKPKRAAPSRTRRQSAKAVETSSGSTDRDEGDADMMAND